MLFSILSVNHYVRERDGEEYNMPIAREAEEVQCELIFHLLHVCVAIEFCYSPVCI